MIKSDNNRVQYLPVSISHLTPDPRHSLYVASKCLLGAERPRMQSEKPLFFNSVIEVVQGILQVVIE